MRKGLGFCYNRAPCVLPLLCLPQIPILNFSGIDPTERFSSRVENYAKYRPGYPDSLLPFMRDGLGLTPDMEVADVGSGTGLLTNLFVENGNNTFAVEPNQPMREAGEDWLGGRANFHSQDGRAEATGLPDNSVDMIVAGQAFHWFDIEQTRPEFARILRDEGYVGLIWNRRAKHTSFLREYVELLEKYAPTYKDIIESHFESGRFKQFFAPESVKTKTLSNAQRMTLDAFKGRLESASYCPSPGDENYVALMRALDKLFAQYEQDDKVSFDYDTLIFYAPLRSTSRKTA